MHLGQRIIDGDVIWRVSNFYPSGASDLEKRANLREYSVGEQVLINDNISMECVKSGTSAESFDETQIRNSDVGSMITDDTVKWLILDRKDHTQVGEIKYSLCYLRGYAKLNGATVLREDYPRLVRYISDNELWSDNVNNKALFGEGDGSSTMVLPDFRDNPSAIGMVPLIKY